MDERLGCPAVTIEPILDRNHRETGNHRVRLVTALPERIYYLSREVEAAFYRYDQALRDPLRRQSNQDLDGTYGRFAIKALRVAGLLASLEDDFRQATGTIHLRHWHRGQQMAERWRHYLHRLIGQLATDVEPSQAALEEQRVLRALRKHGDATARELHRWTKLDYACILEHLNTLREAGVVQETRTSHTVRYSYGFQ